MSTATAGEQINGALRLLGVLAEGETPTADMSADALMAMNQMLDSWSIERLAVYTTQDQVFTWPTGSASRTLGPTGDFVGTRPIQILDSTYFKDGTNNISYGLKLINQDQYNSIALKSATTTYPALLFVQETYPNLTMFVYAVPTRDLEFHIISVLQLSEPAVLATSLAFPPGYHRAFRYNLACEIAPEFGVEPSPQVKRIAMTSKRNLKRVNSPSDIMSMPAVLVNTRPRFNIYSGQF